MAAYEVLTINTNIPQIQAPQSGDTYSFPRVAEFIAGTAAAPALTTTGDTDTGVFFPAANTWAVATGASERMRITSAGDVGIGTTSPSARLAVFGTNSGGDVVARIVNGGSTANTACLLSLDPFGNGVGVRDAQMRAINNGTNAISLTFATANGAAPVEVMRLSPSGNVGIGTTSPAVRLDVVEADITQIRAVATTNGVDTRLNSLGQSANAGVVGTYSNHPFLLYTNSSERMRIDSAGNVGIGTTNPNARLDVAGQIRTEAPTGGTAANWRLGTVHTVSPTSPNRTIEVDIGGTIYYLHAKTTNN